MATVKIDELSAISLFSGALGLDLGLEEAGFTVKVAVESNKSAAETIRKNRPKIHLIERNIEMVTTAEILTAAGLKPGEPALIAGGPSCQSFSTAGQRASIDDPRGTLFRHFLRVVREARPRFFVMENVRGILSAAIKHRPLNKRGPGFSTLKPEEELGSAFNSILAALRELDYYITFNVLNAADYGVPQTRERLLFIGSRDGEAIEMPLPTHSRKAAGGGARWVTVRKALRGLSDPEPEIKTIASRWRKYLAHIPAGGCWRDLPTRLRAKAMGKAYKSWGGRKGFFRRLDWDSPAPALTTRPESKATMCCHPSELRTFSVREYARLQQFPDGWQFAGALQHKYMQIGNAVPVGLAKATGLSIQLAILKGKKKVNKPGIFCASEDLLHRILRGSKTRLNPPRMRRYKSMIAVKAWAARNKGPTQRLNILKHLVNKVDLKVLFLSRRKKKDAAKKPEVRLVVALLK